MLIQPTAPQLVYVVFRRARLIVCTAGLIFASACVYCLVATPKYQAQAGLVAEFSALPSSMPGSTDQSSAPVSTPMDHEEIINSYILELGSSQLLRQVVEEIGVDRLYPKAFSLNPISYLPDFSPITDPELRHEAAVEQAVEHLTKHDLKVEGERDANVIRVTVKNPDRQIAEEFARRLCDAFLQLEARIDRNPRLNLIQKQVTKYRNDVSDAQLAMASFQKSNSISSMSEERTVLIQQRALIEQSMMGTEGRVAENHMRYKSLAAQLNHIAPVVTTSQNDRDPMELGARSNLSDLETREVRLLSEFGSESPAIAAAKKSTSAAKRLLLRERRTPPLTHSDPNVAYQQLQVAMNQAKGDWDAAEDGLKVQRQQYHELELRLAAMDSAESRYEDLVRDYQIADQNYRVYLQGVQEARVAEDLNKANVTSVTVYDAPYAQPKPLRPGMLVLLLAGIGGVMLGLLLALLAEALDETLSRPDQVRDILDLPVIGSIKAAR